MVLALIASLGPGAVGRAAQADDQGTPGPTVSTTAPTTPPTTAPGTGPATGSATSGGSTSPSAPLTRQLAAAVVGPTVVGEDFVLRRGLTESLDVAQNDTCAGGCKYTAGAIPAGWGMSITPAGVMTIWVPGRTSPGAYPVSYTVTDSPLQQATGTVVVRVTPDSYSPAVGMTFTHPYRKAYRNLIRTKVLRTIDSVPPGGRIQVASWSFASAAYRTALRDAKARGVTVQIVLATRNIATNSDWRRLARIFGTAVTPDGSWVRKCTFSCRGTTGTMHSKIFLFSQVYRTPMVEMTGSANLTDFAVTNQWNQMNTVVGDAAIYNEAVGIFNQMSADRPAPYVETHYSDIWTYFYPHGKATPGNDFMMSALAPVHCTGATNTGRSGRTVIKIAMYAWYQYRGAWLARRVRQLWNQGCSIQIVYALLSNQAKSIMYSPAGRGRIPMRQILLTNKKKVPIYYLHDKWVAITGNYGGNTANSVSFQGSFNFSDLGFSSDEQFQMIRGRSVYNRFARDFTLLWTDRQARAPSPVSHLTVTEGRYGQNNLPLGTGVYRYTQPD